MCYFPVLRKEKWVRGTGRTKDMFKLKYIENYVEIVKIRNEKIRITGGYLFRFIEVRYKQKYAGRAYTFLY